MFKIFYVFNTGLFCQQFLNKFFGLKKKTHFSNPALQYANISFYFWHVICTKVRSYKISHWTLVLAKCTKHWKIIFFYFIIFFKLDSKVRTSTLHWINNVRIEFRFRVFFIIVYVGVIQLFLVMNMQYLNIIETKIIWSTFELIQQFKSSTPWFYCDNKATNVIYTFKSII